MIQQCFVFVCKTN